MPLHSPRNSERVDEKMAKFDKDSNPISLSPDLPIGSYRTLRAYWARIKSKWVVREVQHALKGQSRQAYIQSIPMHLYSDQFSRSISYLEL